MEATAVFIIPVITVKEYDSVESSWSGFLLLTSP